MTNMKKQPSTEDYLQQTPNKERPLGISFISVSEAIGSGIGILFGLLIITGGISFFIQGKLFVELGVVFIILSLIALITAKGLWNGRKWAWTVTLILNILGLVFFILVILGIFSFIPLFRTNMTRYIPDLLFNIYIIYYLTRPHVIVFFKR